MTKLKWNSYEDDDFMKQTVYTLQTDSTSPYHEVKIFSRLEMHPVAMLKRTRHCVQVCAGPYGETVYEIDLPFGTKIGDAKTKAIELARRSNAEGNSQFAGI